MSDREYRTAEHLVKEMLWTLIEDGADAVTLSWSRTDKGVTECRHESVGNYFAIVGLLTEAMKEMAERGSAEEEEEESFDD